MKNFLKQNFGRDSLVFLTEVLTYCLKIQSIFYKIFIFVTEALIWSIVILILWRQVADKKIIQKICSGVAIGHVAGLKIFLEIELVLLIDRC